MEENELQDDITNDIDVDETDVEETADEADESIEDTSDDQSDDQKSADEDIDWKERALKAEKVIEKSKQKAKESKKDPEAPKQNDDTDRLRLEVRGVMEQEDQNYVLKFAKAEGISPVDALNDEVVKDKLTHFAKVRTQKAATSAPSGRTAAPGANIDAMVRRYKKDGTLPEDPKLVSKILDKLSQE